MRFKKASLDFFRAPHYAGALFLLSIALLLSSCGEKEGTGDWDHEKKSPPVTAGIGLQTPAPAPEPASEPAPAPVPTPAPAPEPKAPAPVPAAGNPPQDANGPPDHLRFVSYNVKNYLTMSRYVDGARQDRMKPDQEIEAIVKLLLPAKPDVLGICEIGTRQNLDDLQKRLSEAGLDLPHAEYAGGADEVRHLALLSRFPITATDSQSDLRYNLLGKEFDHSRGILDATVAAGDKSFRFLGVHLKSKREVPDGDQDLMRRNEAYLLRKHADAILEKSPDALLCVYGDFNDSRRSTPVRSVQGPSNSNRYLEPLSVKDSRGEVWTHYWDYQHIYSRFDYVLASKALRPLYDWKASYILDDPEWFRASDHRPLLTIFRWDSKDPAPVPE